MTGVCETSRGIHGKGAELPAKWVDFTGKGTSFLQGLLKSYVVKTGVYCQ
jgi:hypothetical protein